MAPNPNHRYWAVPLAVLPLVVLSVIVLSSVYTASRFTTIVRPYAIVPSDAEQVESRLHLTEVQRYPAKGKILFVTLSLIHISEPTRPY